MKKIFLILMLLMTAVTAYADIENAPFIPEIDKRFDAIEQGNHILNNCYPQGSCDGHWVRQLAMATYDFAKIGGSSTANPNAAGPGVYDLGISLPKNAIVTESYLYSVTQPTTASGAFLGFYCQNTGDVKADLAAASYGAAGASVNGASTGATAANFKYTTAKCDLKAKISVGNLTAGKVTAFVEYVVHQ